MNFAIHLCIIYSASLNANIRIFNSSEESLKLHNYSFTACARICILFLSEQWKCCKKLSHLLFFHFLICTQSKFILNKKKTCLLHILPRPTACFIVPMDFTHKSKSKTKLFRISRQQQQNNKSSVATF